MRPENANTTRWSSTSAILKKFQKLEPHLSHCGFTRDVLTSIPDAVESELITSIVVSDMSFASVSQALQRGGDKQLEMNHVRALFDKLIEQHPLSADKLSATSDVIHSHHFESAVCKVQSLDEHYLNSHGKKPSNDSSVMMTPRTDLTAKMKIPLSTGHRVL